MKDPAYELITAIVTLLTNNLTYSSYRFSIYGDLPTDPAIRYVWFPSVSIVDESAQDNYRCSVLLNMQVVSTNHQKNCSLQALNGIGTLILQNLIRGTLTMTNHEISEHAVLDSIQHNSHFEENGGLTRTVDYFIKFVTQQK